VSWKAERSRIRAGAALLFLISLPLCAQDTGAALSGIVADPSGKPVAGARITIASVATAQTSEVQADSAGAWTASNVAPGEYDFSVAAPGFTTTTTRVSISSGARQTVNLTLRGLLSLEDLGFAAQVRGTAADQALLDKRSHMLKLHQTYGLIAAASIVATAVTGGGATGRETSSGSRNIHAALGITSVGLYSLSAYYAIAAPKIPGAAETRGHIRLHKALAWVHGAGMILTPVLGGLAYEQKKNGEEVHGIAKAHGGVAIATAITYAAAILTETLR
jgi:hypothetical protein